MTLLTAPGAPGRDRPSVNRQVIGSSPIAGASYVPCELQFLLFWDWARVWKPLASPWHCPSRRMTLVGSLRGGPVVNENSRAVEKARLEVLQRLLCL